MKNLKKFLYLFSFLFLFFIPKAHARIIIPALPIDDNLPHIISYDGGDGRFFLTYCKNINQTLHLKTEYPTNSSGIYNGNDVVFIGDCYDNNGNYVDSAYRRSSPSGIYLTQEQINNYDFDVDFTWGNESQNFVGLFIDSQNRKIKTWKNYVGQYDEYTYDSVVIEGNTSIYNTSTLYNEILLSQEDYDESLNPDSPSYCPNVGRKLLGQVVNAQSLFFDISGTVGLSNDYLVDGYIDLYTDWKDHEPTWNDIDLTFTLLEDSEITDLSLLTINHSFEWITSNNEHVALRINYSIQSNLSGGFDSFVHLSINLIFNNYILSNLSDPILVYSDTGLCNNTIIGYGYKDSRTGLTNSTNPILENYINNFSFPDMNIFNNLKSLLPPGPVDSILTIPLNILNTLILKLNGSCSSFTLTFPFINSNITLPCINSFYQNTGFTTFFNWIGTLASILILIKYFVFLYNWIDDVLKFGDRKLKAWGTGEV